MKRIVIIALLVLIVAFATGCAGFGDTSDANNWYGIMSRNEFVNHQQDLLALKKLESQPVETAATAVTNSGVAIANNVVAITIPQGYLGAFFNMTRYDRNIVCSGPEKRSFWLGPKGSSGQNDVEDTYLVPGVYTCYSYDTRGRLMGEWTFKSGPQKHKGPNGKEYHWYFIAGR